MSKNSQESFDYPKDKEGNYVCNECNLPEDQLQLEEHSYHGIRYKMKSCCGFHGIFVPAQVIEKWRKQNQQEHIMQQFHAFKQKILSKEKADVVLR